jgi:hypothetical protein
MAVIEGVQPHPGAVRTLAANAALVLSRDDKVVRLSSTDAATKVATMTATQAGHQVTVYLVTRSSTGSYTLAVAGSLTITLDATSEGAVIAYDGSAWQVCGLMGSTVA